MAKQIKILVPLVGISLGKTKPRYEAEGFSGVGCKAATEVFQRAVGSVAEEENKAEMFETEERHEFHNG